LDLQSSRLRRFPSERFAAWSVPEGFNVAYSNQGTISQVLSATLASNTLYTLRVNVGKRLDLAFPTYVIQLWAGNTLLAQDNSSLNPASGQFLLSTPTYQSPASGPVGQNLKIVLSANGAQAEFDAVSLSALTSIGLPSVTIDVPTQGSVVAVSNKVQVGGWAIDNTSVVGTAISSLQVKVDGTVVGYATYGVNRPDVCNVYPGRPKVGYNYWLDTTTLTTGSHTITVSATDSDASPDAGSASVAVTVGSVVTSTTIDAFQACIGPNGSANTCTLLPNPNDPNGRYQVYSTLYIGRSNIFIRGGGGLPGDTSLVRGSSSLNIMMRPNSLVTNVTISNLTFDGQSVRLRSRWRRDKLPASCLRLLGS